MAVQPLIKDRFMTVRPQISKTYADHHRVAAIVLMTASIIERIETGEQPSEAIVEFNAFTGRQFNAEDFVVGVEARDLHGFAIEAALPLPARFAEISREELIWLVEQVMLGTGDSDYYLGLLEANVLHPNASGLIFWPPPHLMNATAEQIVDEILRYRPIAL